MAYAEAIGGEKMKTVSQVAKLTGVSVRTLHHYDALGLLKPAMVTESGYRLYDEEAIARLHSILLFRELEFSLKEIARILDSEDFDKMEALRDQIRLLEMKRDHLDKLIDHARSVEKTGGIHMSFKAFDKSKMDAYAAQAKEKWGKTQAYQEFEEKTKGQTQEQQLSDGDRLMDIFREFGQIRDQDPAGADAQALVKKLQDFITANYYTCTKQILAGLGQMYVAGDSMTDNINAAGGEGTADFASRAIGFFCQ